MNYAANFTLLDYTASVLHGQAVIVRCQADNIGELPWRNEGLQMVNLAYRWSDRAGQYVIADGKRTILKQSVAPGETIACELVIESPPSLASYTLHIDLVAEQVAWFSDYGRPTLDLPVTVEPVDPQRLRVCIINTNCLLNDAVGNSVIEQLTYFEAHGHLVHVLAEFIDERLPLPLRRSIFVTSLEQLRAGLAEPVRPWLARQFGQADLYIVHYPVYYELAEAIQLAEGGTVIFDYHGLTPPHLWGGGAGLALLVQGQQKASLAKFADYAIVHSQYMAEELRSYSGFDTSRIRVIPYGIPVEQFHPMPRDAELVERYGLQNQRALLYIGRMAGNKRIDDLVRMLAAVRRTYPDTVLLLVGDNRLPVYRQICEQASQLAASLGCADQVIFTGPISHAELYRYYNTCDVYVTSSLHEGFCIPVIEAMACGRPVVATDVTALPETVGDAGLLFPAEDVEAMALQVIRILES